jgi:hypothetical protein
MSYGRPVICDFKQIVHGKFSSKGNTGEIRTAYTERVRNIIFFGQSQGNIINLETKIKMRVDFKPECKDHPRTGHEGP